MLSLAFLPLTERSWSHEALRLPKDGPDTMSEVESVATPDAAALEAKSAIARPTVRMIVRRSCRTVEVSISERQAAACRNRNRLKY